MEVLPDIPSQEESVLKPWIDPHQLKQHQGIWYKDGRQVVTGIPKISVTSFNLITIPLFTDTLESAKPYNSRKDCIGGRKCD
jgi:hypothetical protein